MTCFRYAFSLLLERIYIHTYVYTYIHTYTHTYIHACIRICMYVYNMLPLCLFALFKTISCQIRVMYVHMRMVCIHIRTHTCIKAPCCRGPAAIMACAYTKRNMHTYTDRCNACLRENIPNTCKCEENTYTYAHTSICTLQRQAWPRSSYFNVWRHRWSRIMFCIFPYRLCASSNKEQWLCVHEKSGEI
jgi:hypothetical protein